MFFWHCNQFIIFSVETPRYDFNEATTSIQTAIESMPIEVHSNTAVSTSNEADEVVVIDNPDEPGPASEVAEAVATNKRTPKGWTSRRRPHKQLSVIEKAKLEVLQLQKHKLIEEIEQQREIHAVELEISKMKLKYINKN
ncbi:hypothetical protein FQR65_LT02447 [Abscondita terminalis]|nr:hypothetical protein FQR65_LT02447 [Abscondita terminalis]